MTDSSKSPALASLMSAPLKGGHKIQPIYLPYNKNLKQASRNLRNNSTSAEIEMWNFLKMNYKDLKFRRQKPLDNFIVDFYCKSKNLIVEIDGSIHSTQKEKDLERDNILFLKFNLKTIRFTNEQVMKDKNYLRKTLNEVLN